MALQFWQVPSAALLCYSLLQWHWQAALGSRFAGPYITYADSFHLCKDNEWNHKTVIHISNTKHNDRKPLELQRLTGNVSTSDVKQNIDDTYWANSRLDSWSQGEWKFNAFIFNFPIAACSTLRDNMPGIVQATLGTEVLNSKPCRIPPRFYKFDNEPVNWTFPKFPTMPYGHYRFHLTVGKASETTVCLNVECHVIPKPR